MLLLSVLLAAVAVIAAAPFSHVMGRTAGWVLCLPLLTAAGVLVATFFGTSSGTVVEHYPWIPDLGVGFLLRLDGLSLLFALLVLVIGAGVLFYSARYLGNEKIVSFYVLMTVFALAMLLLVLADDLVLLYVAWEATTLTSFFLIARSGPLARQPAIRTLLVTVAGGLCLLTAVCVMIIEAGTSDISAVLDSDLWNQPGLVALLAVLLAVAALTKSAQFPFQAWLPDSMVAISPVSAYLHAAAMVKAGIYLLLLFSPVLAGNPVWSAILIGAGAITSLFGAVAALRRYDMKELLAYSTMSQLGMLVVLIGVGTPLALTAALIHTVAHALFKSSLFMAVGTLDHEAGTRDMRELAGRRIRTRATHTAIILGAVSMAGLPPMFGFISKEAIFEATLQSPGPQAVSVLVTLALAVTAVFTFAYSARLIIGALGWHRAPQNAPRSAHQDQAAESGEVHEGPMAFWFVPWFAASLGLVLGLAPSVLDGLITAATAVVTNDAADVHLALWHGFGLPLLISALVIGIGVVLVVARQRVEQKMVPANLPISGLRVVEQIRNGIISFGERVGGLTPGQNPGVHLLVLCAALPVLGLVGVFAIEDLPDVYGEPTQPLDWLLVAIVAAGVFTTVRAKTRIASVVVVGVVGFGVTLWFFALGAVDVALTQLLVEILTVCVMVLLLKRLPARFESRRRGRIPAGLIAIGAGLAAGLGVWALTGRRGLSEPAFYYLTQGEETTGGSNIVNTILVEFRALDTLGELTVLGVAGLSMAALLASRNPDRVRQSQVNLKSVLSDSMENSVYIRTFTRIAAPIMVVFSLVTLVRGHNEPGGGFIAALIGGAAFALLYLAAPSDDQAPIRWPYLTLIGLGVVVGVGIGLVGMVEGSFLTPLHTEIWGISLNTALVFDIGVYLAVIGVVLAAFNLLGRESPEREGVWGSSAPPLPPEHPRTGVIPVQYQDALNEPRHEALVVPRGSAETTTTDEGN